MFAAVLTALVLVTSGSSAPGVQHLPDKRLLLATAIPESAVPATEPASPVTGTSTPPLPPPSPPASHFDGDLQALICSYPWPCSTAMSLLCESSSDPDPPTAGTPGHYYGLFQVSWETSSDPAVQTRHAYGMYVSAGHTFAPWGWPDGSFGCAFG